LNKNDIDNEDSPLRAYFQKVKNLWVKIIY
jgi:hypothetical protein